MVMPHTHAACRHWSIESLDSGACWWGPNRVIQYVQSCLLLAGPTPLMRFSIGGGLVRAWSLERESRRGASSFHEIQHRGRAGGRLRASRLRHVACQRMHVQYWYRYCRRCWYRYEQWHPRKGSEQCCHHSGLLTFFTDHRGQSSSPFDRGPGDSATRGRG